jgi:VanZ family protein
MIDSTACEQPPARSPDVSVLGPSWVRTALRWAPALAWMAVIFRLSAIPGSNLPGHFSSLGHFVVYAIFGMLLVFALQPRRQPAQVIAIAVFIATVYAVSDEYHQSFVPMRTPDVADWGVDTLGAFAGAAAAALAVRWRASRKPQ